jgi:hypothetical protein
MRYDLRLVWLTFLLLVSMPCFGWAQAAPADDAGGAQAEPALDGEAARAPLPAAAEPDAGISVGPFSFSGYAEVFYQWNFNNPDNGLTANRGFDTRHNSFTLANVALGTSWDTGGFVGALALQIGHTPSTYYSAEPALPGGGGSNASGAELWKYLQQANLGYRIPVGRGLLVSAGLFLSPIGPETIAIKDSWNWSRSTLFYILPYYHTGIRVSYALTDSFSLTLAGYNGWNSVVDNNAEKSVSLQASWARPRWSASLLYFGGVEANPGETGRAWRHLFDGYAQWQATEWFAVLLHIDGGLEPRASGLFAWGAGALSVRARLHSMVFVSARADVFAHVGMRDMTQPAWVASGTATLEVRPLPNLSARFEFRHDHASQDHYFGGVSSGLALNRPTQNTLTLGLTGWF